MPHVKKLFRFQHQNDQKIKKVVQFPMVVSQTSPANLDFEIHLYLSMFVARNLKGIFSNSRWEIERLERDTDPEDTFFFYRF